MNVKQKNPTLVFNYGAWSACNKNVKPTKSVKKMQKYVKDDIVGSLLLECNVKIPYFGCFVPMSKTQIKVEFADNCKWNCHHPSDLAGHGNTEITCDGNIQVTVVFG